MSGAGKLSRKSGMCGRERATVKDGDNATDRSKLLMRYTLDLDYRPRLTSTYTEIICHIIRS